MQESVIFFGDCRLGVAVSNPHFSDSLIPFVGMDLRGEVFLLDGHVFRGIYPGNGPIYEKVLDVCEREGLFRQGVVPTWRPLPPPQLDLGYDLIIEHELIQFITYPHEWPASLFKASALFHIDLYTRLAKHGLIIKDWHPLNILFKNTQPIFVDFTSIIPFENLKHETYLTLSTTPFPFHRLWDTTSAYLFEMYQRMCVPYFLLPLYLMQQNKNQQARRRMFETTLNASRSVMSVQEVFGCISISQAWFQVREFCKKVALTDPRPHKPRFMNLLRREVKNLQVSRTASNYTGYYNEKKEAFSLDSTVGWTRKQVEVNEALKAIQPKTVLDIASNTGWFSKLAAKRGCQVVAIDIDEACIEILHAEAQSEGLSILPLVIDITNPTPDVPVIHYEDEPRQSRIRVEAPLLLAMERRLKCDMVLALAIIHHLTLGQNLTFSYICKMLNALCRKCLILEFIPRHDKLVTSEVDFFPALRSTPHAFEWYSEENLIRELRPLFTKIEKRPSSSDLRTLLFCYK